MEKMEYELGPTEKEWLDLLKTPEVKKRIDRDEEASKPLEESLGSAILVKDTTGIGRNSVSCNRIAEIFEKKHHDTNQREYKGNYKSQ